MHLVRWELVEAKCLFRSGGSGRAERVVGGCVLLLLESWALVQLLHMSEQVEFALWPLFHLSLHFHFSYGKERKHKTVSKTVSKAFWG